MRTETEHFGTCLRRARLDKGLSLAAVAQTTRIPGCSLDAIERGDVTDLPGDVFARGFIRAYARVVGIDAVEPILMYEKVIGLRAESAATPAPLVPADEEVAGKRGLGLAVFVIILLLIATITLSLLLRRPPQSGELLSMDDVLRSGAALLGSDV